MVLIFIKIFDMEYLLTRQATQFDVSWLGDEKQTLRGPSMINLIAANSESSCKYDVMSINYLEGKQYSALRLGIWAVDWFPSVIQMVRWRIGYVSYDFGSLFKLQYTHHITVCMWFANVDHEQSYGSYESYLQLTSLFTFSHRYLTVRRRMTTPIEQDF